MTIYHEERDFQSGPLEADNEREERVATALGPLVPARFEAAGRSALRYRPIEESIADDDEFTRPPRGYRPQRQIRYPEAQPQTPRQTYAYDDKEKLSPMRASRRQAAQLAQPTDEDPQIAPSVRGDKTQEGKRRAKHPRHPAFWIGITLLALLVIWQGTTSGPGWWATTITDPGQYGPTHGTTLTMALGAGDSEITPSTLIAINNNGQVDLIKLFPNDPKKNITFVGPNLNVINFPDATKAEIELTQAGPGKVEVTIWSDQWDRPFHRYGVSFLLVADGKGGLKQVGALTTR